MSAYECRVHANAGGMGPTRVADPSAFRLLELPRNVGDVVALTFEPADGLVDVILARHEFDGRGGLTLGFC